MSETMLKFSKIDWHGVITSEELPVSLFLRKGIPVYIAVRRDLHWVYRNYRHRPAWMAIRKDMKFTRIEDSPGWSPIRKAWIREFSWVHTHKCHEDILFLRLSRSSLEDIALSKSSSTNMFSGHGFLIPQPYRVTGHRTRDRSEIREYCADGIPSLKKVEFCDAFLINKRKWESQSPRSTLTYWERLEECKDSIEIEENDLYAAFSDIEALKKEAQGRRELTPFRYAHRDRMPGIYWMFQAAYALNCKHLIDKAAVLDWLRQSGCAEVFAGKRGGFAAKLVPMELSRGKGRKGGPRPFKSWDIENWSDKPTQFDIGFVGDGLKVALAVAVWWAERLEEDPNVSRVVLARKLYEQNFDQTETGYVVRLISGAELSKEEKGLFAGWVTRREAAEEQKLARELS